MTRIFGAKRRGGGQLRNMLFSVLFFVALVVMLLWGIGGVSGSVESEQLKAIEQAVRRTVAQCYALEGSYPPDIAYLSDNYGLSVDTAKYVVHYQRLGTNLMPQISVFPIASQK